MVLKRRPIPGSPEFRRALMDALQERFSPQSNGSLEIAAGQRVSRNTVIYRARLGSRFVIAKAQITKPPSVAMAEYHMLLDMERQLDGSGVRGLRPVMVLEELGVLVTEEEDGETLREAVEVACRHPETAWSRTIDLIDAAAHALKAFHDAYERQRRVGGTEVTEVRWYLDFSPKNLLIPSRAAGVGSPRLILMDPPEEERWGSRWEDIGGFCYDMTRIRFLPQFLFKPSVAHLIDRLKARFIRGYFGLVDMEALNQVWWEIEAAERRRASQALSWYMRPWRFRNVPKEVLRLCYLGPLTVDYRARGLRRSYREVARLIGESDDGKRVAGESGYAG